MTEFAVGLLELLKGWILKMPDLSVDNNVLSSMGEAMDVVFGFIGKVNFLVPIDHILIIIGLVYTIRHSKFILFIINWIIRRIADFVP